MSGLPSHREMVDQILADPDALDKLGMLFPREVSTAAATSLTATTRQTAATALGLICKSAWHEKIDGDWTRFPGNEFALTKMYQHYVKIGPYRLKKHRENGRKNNSPLAGGNEGNRGQ